MTEFANVLWKPKQTIEKIATGNVRTAALVLTLLAIDFFLSLTLLPLVHASASRALALHPELSHKTLGVIMAFSITVSSLSDLVVALFISLLVYFATMVFGGTGSYRRIFELVLIGSAPLLLSRIVRLFLYLFKVTPSILPAIAPISALVPASFPHFGRIAGFFDLIDFWSLALYVYGYSRISGLRRWISYAICIVFWCLLQAVLLQLRTMVVPK